MERQVQNILAASQMGATTSITQQPGFPQRTEIKSAVKYLGQLQVFLRF